jgi:hypothetical protein
MLRQLVAMLIVVAVAGITASAPMLERRVPPPPALARADFAHLPLAFEPNAGQSDARVRYLAHSPAGLLFFTPGEVVLVLKAPPSDTRPEVGLPAAGTAGPVLRVRFIGANVQGALVAGETLPGRVNYFVGNSPTQWHSGLPTYAQLTYANLFPGVTLAYAGGGGALEGTYTVAPGTDPAQIRWRYEGAEAVTLGAGGNLQIRLLAAQGLLTERAPVAWQDLNGQRVSVAARYTVAPDGSFGFALGAYDRTQPLVIDPTLTYSTYLGGGDWDNAQGITVDAAGSAYVTGWTWSTAFPLQDPVQGTQAGYTDAFVTKFSPSGQALVYSTYLGGANLDSAYHIAVDAAGSAYVSGSTWSNNFPLQSPFQSTNAGADDAFVTKLSPSGAALVYSTYLGGSDQDDGSGIGVDAAGNAYVSGWTYSTNFPLQNPFQSTNAGSLDAFVTKFSSSGQALVYSTYLGGTGSEYGKSIAVDAAGSAYVAGQTASANFPLQRPFQGIYGGGLDAFVTKFSASGKALVYSTYLGGSNLDDGTGIAVDAVSSAYVTGDTYSANFPLQSPFQSRNAGTYDAFVTKLDPSGAALGYSTYLGGTRSDGSQGIAVDSAGSAYVAGQTTSADFPLQDPIQGAYGGVGDAFVTKLSSSGTELAYSTYLGGTGDDQGHGIAVDAAGSAYVTGETYSIDFPLQNPFQSTYGGGSYDAFVAKVSQPLATPTAAPTLTPTATATVTSHTLYCPFLAFNASQP